jgi:general stress protein YciG
MFTVVTTLTAMEKDDEMNKQDISKLFSDLGRKGGKARAKTLTPERRKEIARKASKAAAEKRTKKKGSAR